MSNLSLKVAYSLYDRMIDDPARLLNVDIERLEILTQDVSWTVKDRPAVRIALDAVLFGNLDELGLPRFTLPCEYVAAAIVKFVKPVNVMIACIWSERHGNDADDMSIVQEEAHIEQLTASRLFAFCCLLAAKIESAEKKFNQKTSNAINRIDSVQLANQIDAENLQGDMLDEKARTQREERT